MKQIILKKNCLQQLFFYNSKKLFTMVIFLQLFKKIVYNSHFLQFNNYQLLKKEPYLCLYVDILHELSNSI